MCPPNSQVLRPAWQVIFLSTRVWKCAASLWFWRCQRSDARTSLWGFGGSSGRHNSLWSPLRTRATINSVIFPTCSEGSRLGLGHRCCSLLQLGFCWTSSMMKTRTSPNYPSRYNIQYPRFKIHCDITTEPQFQLACEVNKQDGFSISLTRFISL